MGGVVADRAFASGLSANDGVATYVALASPHSGSSNLAASTRILDSLGDRALELRAIFSPKVDLGSDAARGLATTRPAPPPAGVARLDLRMATDWTVTKGDARDPGVQSRILVPSGLGGLIDGHGAVTSDPAALQLVTSTIERNAVPPDTRGWQVKLAAELGSLGADGIALLALLALFVGCCGVGPLANPLVRLVTRPLAEMQLRAVRRK
jgi:hypothetical protein